MLWLVLTILSIVGSTTGYPQQNGEVVVGFNLVDFLESLSIPFFGFGYNEKPQNEAILDEGNQNDGDDSSGAEVESFAEAGVDANGNVFANAGAEASKQEDDSDEGFALVSFTSTVIQAIGDEISIDSFAGSQVIEEDGDLANSFSVASVDVNDNGITASSDTLSEAFVNGAPSNINNNNRPIETQPAT